MGDRQRKRGHLKENDEEFPKIQKRLIELVSLLITKGMKNSVRSQRLWFLLIMLLFFGLDFNIKSYDLEWTGSAGNLSKVLH